MQLQDLFQPVQLEDHPIADRQLRRLVWQCNINGHVPSNRELEDVFDANNKEERDGQGSPQA